MAKKKKPQRQYGYAGSGVGGQSGASRVADEPKRKWTPVTTAQKQATVWAAEQNLKPWEVNRPKPTEGEQHRDLVGRQRAKPPARFEQQQGVAYGRGKREATSDLDRRYEAALAAPVSRAARDDLAKTMTPERKRQYQRSLRRVGGREVATLRTVSGAPISRDVEQAGLGGALGIFPNAAREAKNMIASFPSVVTALGTAAYTDIANLAGAPEAIQRGPLKSGSTAASRAAGVAPGAPGAQLGAIGKQMAIQTAEDAETYLGPIVPSRATLHAVASGDPGSMLTALKSEMTRAGDRWWNEPIGGVLTVSAAVAPVVRVAGIRSLSIAIKAANPELSRAEALELAVRESYRPGTALLQGKGGGFRPRTLTGRVEGGGTFTVPGRAHSTTPVGRALQRKFDQVSRNLDTTRPKSRWSETSRAAKARKRIDVAESERARLLVDQDMQDLAKFLKGSRSERAAALLQRLTRSQTSLGARTKAEGRAAALTTALQGPRGAETKSLTAAIKDLREILDLGGEEIPTNLRDKVERNIYAIRASLPVDTTQGDWADLRNLMMGHGWDSAEIEANMHLMEIAAMRWAKADPANRDPQTFLSAEDGLAIEKVLSEIPEQGLEEGALFQLLFPNEAQLPRSPHNPYRANREAIARGEPPPYGVGFSVEHELTKGGAVKEKGLRNLHETARTMVQDGLNVKTGRVKKGFAAIERALPRKDRRVSLKQKYKAAKDFYENASPDMQAEMREWYERMWDWIAYILDEDPKRIGAAFYASQAAQGPAGGMAQVLRTLEDIAAGAPEPTSFRERNIYRALKGEDLGVAGPQKIGIRAKLSDFHDSGFGLLTRTLLGGEGEPGVVDRWTFRSDGYVDPAATSWRAKQMTDRSPAEQKAWAAAEADDKAIFDPGTWENAIAYEYSNLRLSELLKMFNENKVGGRSDWTPDQVQAVDWLATKQDWVQKGWTSDAFAEGGARDTLLQNTHEFVFDGNEEDVQRIIDGEPGIFLAPGFATSDRPRQPAWWDEPSENAFFKGARGEEIMDWLERHEVPRNPDGTYRFYHATPKGREFGEIRGGSYLETDPERAVHFAGRDRDLGPDDIEVIPLDLYPWEIRPGVHPTLRDAVPTRARGEEARFERGPNGVHFQATGDIKSIKRLEDKLEAIAPTHSMPRRGALSDKPRWAVTIPNGHDAEITALGIDPKEITRVPLGPDRERVFLGRAGQTAKSKIHQEAAEKLARLDPEGLGVERRVHYPPGKRIKPDPETTKTRAQAVRVGGQREIKGAVEFLDNNKRLVYLLEKGDAGTFWHELLGHAPDYFKQEFPEEFAAYERHVGRSLEDWTRRDEERFARHVERYMRDGKAPTPETAAVFDQIKRWLQYIYEAARYMRPIPREMRDMLDKNFGMTRREWTPEERARVREARAGGATQEELERLMDEIDADTKGSVFTEEEQKKLGEYGDLLAHRQRLMEDEVLRFGAQPDQQMLYHGQTAVSAALDPDASAAVKAEARQSMEEIARRRYGAQEEGMNSETKRMLNRQVDALERGIREMGDNEEAFQEALGALIALSEEADRLFREVIIDTIPPEMRPQVEAMMQRRRNAMVDRWREKGLMDYGTGNAMGYFPHFSIFESLFDQLTGPVRRAAGANRTIGKPRVTQTAARKGPLKFVRWQRGQVNFNPKALLNVVHARMRLQETRQVRDLLWNIGRKVEPNDQIPEGWYIVNREGKTIPTRMRAMMNMDRESFDYAVAAGEDFDSWTETAQGMDELMDEYIRSFLAGGPRGGTLRRRIPARVPQDWGNVELRVVPPEIVEGMLGKPFQSKPGGWLASLVGVTNSLARIATILQFPLGYIVSNNVANALLLGLTHPTAFRDLPVAAALRHSNKKLYERIALEAGDIQAEAGLPDFYPAAQGKLEKVERGFVRGQRAWARGLGEVADTPYRVASYLAWARRYGMDTPDKIDTMLRDPNLAWIKQDLAQRTREDMIDFNTLTTTEKETVARYFFLWPLVRGMAKWPVTFAREQPITAFALSQAGDEEFQDKFGYSNRIGNAQQRALRHLGIVTMGDTKAIDVTSVNPVGGIDAAIETMNAVIKGAHGDPYGALQSLGAAFLNPQLRPILDQNHDNWAIAESLVPGLKYVTSAAREDSRGSKIWEGRDKWYSYLTNRFGVRFHPETLDDKLVRSQGERERRENENTTSAEETRDFEMAHYDDIIEAQMQAGANYSQADVTSTYKKIEAYWELKEAWDPDADPLQKAALVNEIVQKYPELNYIPLYTPESVPDPEKYAEDVRRMVGQTRSDLTRFGRESGILPDDGQKLVKKNGRLVIDRG